MNLEIPCRLPLLLLIKMLSDFHFHHLFNYSELHYLAANVFLYLFYIYSGVNYFYV